MFRIKLPGSNKTKVIILIIMVVLAIGIIFKVGIDNNSKKSTNIYNEKEINESIDQNVSKEEDINEEVQQEEIVDEREELLYQEAFAIFHSGNYIEAINKADALIAEYPDSYKGYNIRGIAKAYNGSFEEGMQDIDKSLSINDKYGYALFNKALNYELYGYYDDAILWYEKELDIEEYSWGYYGMASIYGRYGDVDKTVEYLSKAIEVGDREGIKETIIEEAKTETDFDPVRSSSKFNELLAE